MRSNERGFAIPVTVLLIVIITVMLSAGFVRVRSDRQVSEGQEASNEAVAVARSGLASFLDAQDTRPPDGFVDTVYVPGGYATITAHVLQKPADTLASQTWVIRSTGYVIDPSTGATPRARRTVAQFAAWQSGTMNVRGALAAANGIQLHNRGQVYVNGNDACLSAPAVPGIRSAGLTGVAPATLSVDGSPASVDHGPSEGLLVAGQTDIAWSDVLGGGIVADYYGAVPNFNFNYPITIVYGDYAPTSYVYGTGLLIVTGDFEPASWVFFQGIVLVGGRLRLGSSFNYFSGAVVTGLSEQLGSNPQMTELGWNGSVFYNTYGAQFRYQSCHVRDALAGLTGFAPIPNARVDNWATF